MRRFASIAIALCLLGGSAYAGAALKPFPKLRYGIGNEPTSGGGIVAGKQYVTRSAVMAWSKRSRTLTLYLIRQSGANCRNLQAMITRRGMLIQALIVARPLKPLVGRRIPAQTLQFVYHGPNARVDVGGLKKGVRLVITRIDSFPGGVWHGSLTVPTKAYSTGKVYGYRGTFAARWCQVR